MSEDYTLKSEHLITMEQMRKTLEIVQFHLDNIKNEFQDMFGMVKTDKNFQWNQLRSHGRLCYYQNSILLCEKRKWSEVLYGIELHSLKCLAQFFVAEDHSQFKAFNANTLHEGFRKEVIKNTE